MLQNSHVNAGRRFKGVTKRGSRFIAAIRAYGVKRVLGSFKTEEEAARSYDRAARHWHGQFARLNFPRPGEQPARRGGVFDSDPEIGPKPVTS